METVKLLQRQPLSFFVGSFFQNEHARLKNKPLLLRNEGVKEKSWPNSEKSEATFITQYDY